MQSDNFTNSPLRFMGRFRRFFGDIAGVVTLTIALLTLYALLSRSGGVVLDGWSMLLRRWLGWGSGFIVLALFAAGVKMLRHQKGEAQPTPWGRIVALEIAVFALLAILALAEGNSLARARSGLDGGLIGWGLAQLATGVMPLWLAGLLYGLIAAIAALSGLGTWRAFDSWLQTGDEDRVSMTIYDRENAATTGAIPISQPPARREAPPTTLQVGAKEPEKTKLPKKFPRLGAEFRKNLHHIAPDEKPAQPLPRDERLPPLDLLLDEGNSRPDERHINLTAGLIEKCLAEFGIPAKVIGFQVGPTITQFAVEPGFLEKPGTDGEANRQKVRVAQIASLSRDLALALAAPRLRIEAPVPGRPYIGIEVPNTRSMPVRLRPILETEAFQALNSPLAIALGRDVSGKAVVADLAKMPHLLIAGTTGSGKSVCIAALTTCLVMNNTPEDLRLVMIDPKMVELVRFNGLPHLMGKVETDLERILGVLRWTVVEMERRYKLLESSRSRHLDSHNRKMRRRPGAEVLPHIVVMIDELADLMMTAPDQTEHVLVRLAQMARATGIHLVVATQRPSTDVVTGLIKANFPARLSFAVASAVDSRVILDNAGAEMLLGRGDMLFLPADAPAPIRAQGVMVTDAEIERLIAFWQSAQSEAAEATLPPWEKMIAEEEMQGDQDALLEQAIAIVRQTQRANTSLLQRRLRIGYPRAARLIDEMESMGIVGPPQPGGRDREVLIGPEDESPTSNEN